MENMMAKYFADVLYVPDTTAANVYACLIPRFLADPSKD